MCYNVVVKFSSSVDVCNMDILRLCEFTGVLESLFCARTPYECLKCSRVVKQLYVGGLWNVKLGGYGYAARDIT